MKNLAAGTGGLQSLNRRLRPRQPSLPKLSLLFQAGNVKLLPMKHILFPTVSAADAFIADLQGRGAVQPEVGSMSMSRRVQNAATDGAAPTASMGTTSGTTTTTTTEYVGGGTAEDAGEGAVKGTVAGAVTGAAAGVLGTAATVATGGLALPVILGMAALGSGVGAAVGAIGGAAGVDETGGTVSTTNRTSYPASYEADDAYYNRVNDSVNSGGRVVAVDDNVDQGVLMDALSRHGGEIIQQ